MIPQRDYGIKVRLSEVLFRLDIAKSTGITFNLK